MLYCLKKAIDMSRWL